jgi:hypothetical protein
MCSNAVPPRPEAENSYFCDETTRLSNAVHIDDPYGRFTSFQYNIDRPFRSSKVNPKAPKAKDKPRRKREKKRKDVL